MEGLNNKIWVIQRRTYGLYDPYVNYVMEKKGMDQFNAFKYMGLVETVSVAAAIENLLLAAHSLGYGSCWLRVPFMAKDELEKMLGVHPP